MRKNIVAGNWKMNKTLSEGIQLANELKESLAETKINCDVIIIPPFIHLASISQIISNTNIKLGAQNCSKNNNGAFTGDISAEMVKSTGAQYVLIGHSERRQYHCEDSSVLSTKLSLALKEGLLPIYCFGEMLEDRENGNHFKVIQQQIEEVIYSFSTEDLSKIVLAYEPVWAIGTGKTASSDQAQEMHKFARSIIEKQYGIEIAQNISILYGGSCKPSNAKELFSNPDVDGGLIGGASLISTDFMGIINAF